MCRTRQICLANTAGSIGTIAAAYEVPAAEKGRALQKLGRLFDMLSHEEETIASFSHGMRQKTLLIGH